MLRTFFLALDARQGRSQRHSDIGSINTSSQRGLMIVPHLASILIFSAPLITVTTSENIRSKQRAKPQREVFLRNKAKCTNHRTAEELNGAQPLRQTEGAHGFPVHGGEWLPDICCMSCYCTFRRIWRQQVPDGSNGKGRRRCVTTTRYRNPWDWNPHLQKLKPLINTIPKKRCSVSRS
jgi:hypothetical protein